MLSKRPHPVIGKLSEFLASVNRAAFSETLTSPRSPLDFRPLVSPSHNPKKGYDVGCVGLGFIASLEESNSSVAKSDVMRNHPIPRPDPMRSEPIPFVRKTCEQSFRESEDLEMEDYTYVTCRLGPNESYTRVYHDGSGSGRRGLGRRSNGLNCSQKRSEEMFQYPSDFLSCCDLCKKKLDGKDVYMYRGEKAFCSPDCRSSHMTMDERKEQCRSEISSSPYVSGEIFSTGIIVS